jgi:alpha-amylase/alpha-mannosidase (GH57 family)
MTERYLCIHGHFYQPPRENPWLEAIEIQDSAYPYHDWNDRITAECYAPNSAARNLDGDGRILDIESNYARTSFNFGPTLLSWLEKKAPETYGAIIEADRKSIEWRSGHGNALAQVYNHIIMPLANSRDKRTQILWGIGDFEYRFGRSPEGMWLAETAVDNETLNLLAELGIRFTILAPRQAWKMRRLGTGKWRDVSGSRIDPSRAYLCRLPSGRSIHLFFYDGPISQGVAFEGLLKRGDDFAHRLLSGFSDVRDWPQLFHIATDGETYGHHQRYGDMALAYALNYIESNGLARLTNYGEYLERYPPTHEVQIFENSSWSCVHGIERWRGNCGCNTGGHPGWSQEWRRPLREALDWLRDRLSGIYESVAHDYLKDPWSARDGYVQLILSRSDEQREAFFSKHALRSISDIEKVTVLKLLEMQRHAMLMYTSCGWFFDELSGLETVQILKYAGRAIQLSEDIFHYGLEDTFRARLSLAKSNIPEHENGAIIYEQLVKPAMIDLKKVGAHFAVSSLFEDYIDETKIYSYIIQREDYQRVNAGVSNIAIGKVSVSAEITHESDILSFCILHFGGHALNGGVRTFLGPDAYHSMKTEIMATFERGDFADIVRLMDKHFGMHNYSLANLFRDQQRIILDSLISKTTDNFEQAYRQLYENNRILMGFLSEAGMPVKKAFIAAAELILNADVEKAFLEEPIDVKKIQGLLSEMNKWNIPLYSIDIEYKVRKKLEECMRQWQKNHADVRALIDIQSRLELYRLLPIEINYWQTQNMYYQIAKTHYAEILQKGTFHDEEKRQWINALKYVGDMLFFNTSSVLNNS